MYSHVRNYKATKYFASVDVDNENETLVSEKMVQMMMEKLIMKKETEKQIKI